MAVRSRAQVSIHIGFFNKGESDTHNPQNRTNLLQIRYVYNHKQETRLGFKVTQA